MNILKLLESVSSCVESNRNNSPSGSNLGDDSGEANRSRNRVGSKQFWRGCYLILLILLAFVALIAVCVYAVS